jgi:hypothetical protein
MSARQPLACNRISMEVTAFVAKPGGTAICDLAMIRETFRRPPVYIARFSYAVAPVDRQRAIDLIQREVRAASGHQLKARLLIPLTRGPGGAALQFEVELPGLDTFEQFRERGMGSDEQTGDWMHAFSEILICPPEVELLRVDEAPSTATSG